jgi:hypothetical protein
MIEAAEHATSSGTLPCSSVLGLSENTEVTRTCTYGSFRRTFSGTAADLWRLALDPNHALRSCVTDGDSGLALNYQQFTQHAARYASITHALIDNTAYYGDSDKPVVWLSELQRLVKSLMRLASQSACQGESHLFLFLLKVVPVTATTGALQWLLLCGHVIWPVAFIPLSMQRFQRSRRQVQPNILTLVTGNSFLNFLQRFIFENTRTKFLLCAPSTLPEADAIPDDVRVAGCAGGLAVCPVLFSNI